MKVAKIIGFILRNVGTAMLIYGVYQRSQAALSFCIVLMTIAIELLVWQLGVVRAELRQIRSYMKPPLDFALELDKQRRTAKVPSSRDFWIRD